MKFETIKHVGKANVRTEHRDWVSVNKVEPRHRITICVKAKECSDNYYLHSTDRQKED